MLELIVSSFLLFGNMFGSSSIWAPNSFTWISPSDRPGEEQIYEPLLESTENNEQDKRVL
jgi:hypothetical protein